MRTKVVSRYLAYHGTSLGASASPACRRSRSVFEPLLPGAIKVQTPYRYRCDDCAHLDACTLRCADDLALRIEMEGRRRSLRCSWNGAEHRRRFAPPEGYWAAFARSVTTTAFCSSATR